MTEGFQGYYLTKVVGISLIQIVSSLVRVPGLLFKSTTMFLSWKGTGVSTTGKNHVASQFDGKQLAAFYYSFGCIFTGFASNTGLLRRHIPGGVGVALVSEERGCRNFDWHTGYCLSPIESLYGFLMFILIFIYHHNKQLYATWQLLRESGQVLLPSFTDKEGRVRKIKSSVHRSDKWYRQDWTSLQWLLLFISSSCCLMIPTVRVRRHIFLAWLWFFRLV